MIVTDSIINTRDEESDRPMTYQEADNPEGSMWWLPNSRTRRPS